MEKLLDRIRELEVPYWNFKFRWGVKIHMVEEFAYHIGASLKDAGKKCFAINKIEDKIIIADILNRLVKKQDDDLE